MRNYTIIWRHLNIICIPFYSEQVIGRAMRPGRIKTENGALNGVKCVKNGALLWLRLYKFTLK